MRDPIIQSRSVIDLDDYCPSLRGRRGRDSLAADSASSANVTTKGWRKLTICHSLDIYLQLLYVHCLIVFKCLSFEDFKRFHPSPFKIAFGSLFDNSVLEDKSPFFGMASFC